MTGDVVSIGKCGQSVDFVLYSDGRLLLKGTGATFDYSTDSNPSPLQNNANIKSVIVSEGVTGIEERLFQYCDNLKTVSLPTMLTAIKKAAFLPHIDGYICHQSLNGLTELKIPEPCHGTWRECICRNGNQVRNRSVLCGNRGAMAFSECQHLETVRYGGKVISDRMFI